MDTGQTKAEVIAAIVCNFYRKCPTGEISCVITPCGIKIFCVTAGGHFNFEIFYNPEFPACSTIEAKGIAYSYQNWKNLYMVGIGQIKHRLNVYFSQLKRGK